MSYPGEEAEKLLRNLLENDPIVEYPWTQDGKRGPKYYPVRQTAFLALRLLGCDADPPEPCSEDFVPTGFFFAENPESAR
ncbi:MAG: hypothetical protein R6W76_02080, partial [Caldilinea sp.]